MHPVIDEERFQAAASRFVAFFAELGESFVEREELLLQIELALLSRQHVLMCGPPGTAKSALASAVLRRILDEKSGAPSVFARQFTESTVQTDLIGPIDFKTLTETGRSEHITEEGMLGSVHAFLDEVLDGRDMLLRSTLNVLHERELRQGSKITAGAIECALMTTNRYLSEVLEQSRETLLAFVDRIAFVSFVPRGFALQSSLNRVLHGQVGGRRGKTFSCPLTIQDLDVLQAAADQVHVPEELCETLATFLKKFETEIAAAVRADPQFLPTRYLSTRTIVTLGRLLKAVCVRDRAFAGSDRPLSVTFEDFEGLRLSLLLSGPKKEHLSALIEAETDPRERRQLSIMLTEREIYDRCLEGLERPPTRRLPTPAPSRKIRRRSVEELRERDLFRQAAALVESADDGPLSREDSERLERTLAELSRRALKVGLTLELDEDGSPHHIAKELSLMADRIESTRGDQRPVARWLRGRALDVLHQAAQHAPSTIGANLEMALRSAPELDQTSGRAWAALSRPLAYGQLRAHLRAGGALEENFERGETAWKNAGRATALALTRLWDTDFRGAVEQVLASTNATDLAGVLERLEPWLSAMDETDEKLAELGADAPSVKGEVVTTRLGPLVRATFERFDARNRTEVSKQVESVLQILGRAGLGGLLSPRDLVTWTAEALLRSDQRAEVIDGEDDAEHYRKLRADDQRVAAAYALADLCLDLLPRPDHSGVDPLADAQAVRDLLGELPEELRQRLVQSDLSRVERPLEVVERWWTRLASEIEALDDEAAVEHLVASRFFRVVADEQALVRFQLELDLVRRLFPEAAEAVAALDTRIDAVGDESVKRAYAILSRRASTHWKRVLGESAAQ